jgi:hypothetical protein
MRTGHQEPPQSGCGREQDGDSLTDVVIIRSDRPLPRSSTADRPRGTGSGTEHPPQLSVKVHIYS